MKEITLEFENNNQTYVETIAINEGDKIILQFPTTEYGGSLMSKDTIGKIVETFKMKLQNDEQVMALPDSIKIKVLQIKGEK